MAVAQAALRSIGPTHASWVASVRRLHTERREYVRSLATGDWSEESAVASMAAESPQPSTTEATPAARPAMLITVWWTLLSVAAVAATIGAVPLIPLQIAQDPALILAITPAAMLLAGALLVLTAAFTPRSARSGTALGLALSSAVFAAAAAALSAVRWDLLMAAGGASNVLTWLIGATGTVVGGTVLAWRAAPRRERSVELKPAEHARREFAIELVSRARRYARKVPIDEAVRERWRIELAELAGNVPLESIEQARALGPWAWLVWAAYDGEVHLPDLLAARR
ncbi:hypothetical protein [Agrococcus sp. ProA11]|uniref:hypothetical protein n=1 Tax=Agrococcus chionoecetis TaxID=3153752 RepID=UPI0032604478